MVKRQGLDLFNTMGKGTQQRKLPAMFSTMSMDRDSLVSDWHVAAYSSSGLWSSPSKNPAIIPETGTWQVKSGSVLARWTSAYDVYLDIRGDSLTARKRKGAASLRILKELGSIARMVSQTTVEDQMDWDVLCPMFEKIVSLAEDIVEVDLQQTACEAIDCIDMTIVRLLFEVSPIVLRLLMSLTLSRSAVAVESPSYAEEESQSFEDAGGWKGCGMLF